MKVVTAAAGLDSGDITPTTVLNAESPKEIGGFPLENFGNQSFPSIDATDALTNSVNTYWAQVGERLGSETYIDYMERFGFNADPALDYPDAQMAPSGVQFEGGLAQPGDPVDIGRVAIGQGGLTATPMQMAEVAATIANGGSLMAPTLLQEAKDPDGRTIEDLDPDEQAEAVSAETAAAVTEMMTNVTNEGTASGLTVPGVDEFAGKTGTAEIDVAASTNQPWFIGFAPSQDPQIAVAVTIERCTGCTGGEVAGPIATEVMGSLLGG
jgi:penicillin-binding protein A